jgi:hypothetical protein
LLSLGKWDEFKREVGQKCGETPPAHICKRRSIYYANSDLNLCKKDSFIPQQKIELRIHII